MAAMSSFLTVQCYVVCSNALISATSGGINANEAWKIEKNARGKYISFNFNL
jgi:hypothetical protein